MASSSSSSSTSKRGRQTTLFQTWGYQDGNSSNSTGRATQQQHKAGPSTSATATDSAVAFEPATFDDEDDELLSRALEQSVTQFKLEEASRSYNDISRTEGNSGATTARTASSTSFNAGASVDTPGFDPSAGSTWTYPTNYPVRSYQFSIVESALFQNTLVTLPTGLGKTFIAAVVMYNFYRWYPASKIVFMAPTRTLVTQQIEACFDIMGIPQDEMVELTGAVKVKLRERAWRQKRILFLTPHVMSNDLARGVFPADEVRLVVVDEAHKAQGDYAYCQVVRELQKSGTVFRVLALSATPGTDLNGVKLMLQNLLISKIELRSEESADIVPYTHERRIRKVVVPFGAELTGFRRRFLRVLEVYVRRLSNAGALARRGNSPNPEHYSKFGVLQSRNEFRQNPPRTLAPRDQGPVEGDFACAISLYHAFDLLMQHGLRSFNDFMRKILSDDSSNRRLKYELRQSQVWAELAADLEAKFSGDLDNSRLNASRPRLSGTQTQSDGGAEDGGGIVLGHPKLEKLRELVLEHFRAKESSGVATRAMIFSQYRDSVKEIAACLHAHRPLIKVMEFVGQAGNKGKKGLTQKEQVEVVRRFRDGGFNTLVATCVGEEGLDIGEVDLIVCYDVSKSPIRLVQRMGRTGRKRDGNIIVLVTEGKEEQTYNQSMSSKNSINRAILDKRRLASFLVPSPRMLPPGVHPECLKMTMEKREFSKAAAEPVAAILPDGTRRISGMLEKKKGKKRKSEQEKEKTECKRAKTEDREEVERVEQEEELQPPPPGKNPFLSDDEEDFGGPMEGEDTGQQQQQMDIKTCFARIEKIPRPESKAQDSLSDLDEEVLQELNRKLTQEEEEAEVNPDDAPLPEWLALGEEDGEEDGEPTREPPDLAVVQREVAPAVRLATEDEWRDCLERARQKYRSRRRKKEVRQVPDKDDLEEVFKDGDEFFFDVSEWDGGAAAETDEKEDAEVQEVVDVTRHEYDDAFGGNDQSPVFNSQRGQRSSSSRGRTSTPNVSSGRRALSRTLGFCAKLEEELPTPVRNKGVKILIKNDADVVDDGDLADQEMVFDDSSFGQTIAAHVPTAASQGSVYGATQLAAMLDKTSVASQQEPSSHSPAVAAVSAAPVAASDSLKDLFGDDDDDSFLMAAASEQETEKKTEIGFKKPDLSQFEASLNQAKTPPAAAKSSASFRSRADLSRKSLELSERDADGDGDGSYIGRGGKNRMKLESSSSSSSSSLTSSSPPRSQSIVVAERKARSFGAEEEMSPEMRRGRGKVARFAESSVEESRVGGQEEEEERPEIGSKKRRKSRKNKKKGNGFVLCEAEISDDHDCSSGGDDDGSDLEKLEESFVDDFDETQGFCTQQHANYLRSVRSPPPASAGAMRRPGARVPMADVYSQPVADQGDSSYMDDEDDSFVVGNDSEMIEMDSVMDELDYIDEGDRTCLVKRTAAKPAKKKRIRQRLASSSSEEEEQMPPPPPPPVAAKPPVSNRALPQAEFLQPPPPAPPVRRPDESVTLLHPADPDRSMERETRPTIVANTAEMHKMTQLVSCLKHKHKFQFHVRYLEGATMMVSPRMGLERRMLGEFCNGANRQKVIERCQLMNDLFDRPCLVLETDRPSEDGTLPKVLHTPGQHRTKYVDALLSQLASSKMQVLYSDGPEQTARLVAALATREAKKGQAFPRPLELTDFQDKVLVPFYLTLPCVSLGTALVMASRFDSVSSLCNAARATIMRKAGVDEDKAVRIQEHIRRNYQPEDEA